MRPLIIIGAASVATIGAWWWLKQSRPTPAAVNSAVPGQTPSTTTGEKSPLDYLNFDFSALLSGDSTMKQDKPYQTEAGNPLPQGIRLNNPLNIRENERVNFAWQGEHPDELSSSFEEFTTAFYGIRAAARNLKTYRDKYGLTTISQIITKWAPPHENPTQKYIDFVSNRAGVAASSPLSMADYPNVIAAMIYFENGYNPYDQAEIARATAAGFE